MWILRGFSMTAAVLQCALQFEAMDTPGLQPCCRELYSCCSYSIWHDEWNKNWSVEYERVISVNLLTHPDKSQNAHVLQGSSYIFYSCSPRFLASCRPLHWWCTSLRGGTGHLSPSYHDHAKTNKNKYRLIQQTDNNFTEHVQLHSILLVKCS